ncbi:biotin synthase [Nitratiruptor sp. SB155-2]|uniref:Biotin synthase n=1 Tax=Nitratiruptor sp. (strain SB155-2) TaxID=387092 RepID=BIOB_NITSB|nr:biotin synthase [Nitratiruptor sp. SB155-2]A6Q5K0.1 RecName: Full=Biotin synthase [Nitratiruptor sp. SB155-2]BAF70759.1 biotin synthase [Nitratiruptor sp. SB155-2]
MKVYLCAISNISSGVCAEDCKFCTQSTKYRADIPRYKYKSIETIVEEAKKAKAAKAIGFCLVTAGKGIDDKILDFVTQAARAVKKEVPDISLIGCNGTAEVWQLKELKHAGIDNYNHNLETAKSFYEQICSTHSWEERYQTCLNAKEAGLNLCTGGIFGLGESKEQREEMMDQIASLEPMSVPINFYHPNEALPLPQTTIDPSDALSIIQDMRKRVPNAMIMVAGGRELVFGEQWPKILDAGANAIVIGDYLTTKGERPDKDIQTLQKLGVEIATSCHE